jgi:hypothetical protein
MRRYIIDVDGDNDDLHAKALEAACKAIKGVNHARPSAAVVVAPEPGEVIFSPILNCTRRVT